VIHRNLASKLHIKTLNPLDINAGIKTALGRLMLIYTLIIKRLSLIRLILYTYISVTLSQRKELLAVRNSSEGYYLLYKYKTSYTN
jgi:hypothetical protein